MANHLPARSAQKWSERFFWPADHRRAKIANLQGCNRGGHNEENGTQIIAVRHTAPNSSDRQNNNGRNEDKNLKAATKQGPDNQNSYREGHGKIRCNAA